MRIVRFSPGPNSGLGTDPLFGLLEEDGTNISVIAGDPIYAGVSKTGAVTQLSDVRLLAPSNSSQQSRLHRKELC